MPLSLKQTYFRRLNLLAILSALLLGFLLFRTGRLILLSDLQNKGQSTGRILAAVTLDAVMVHDYATVERYVTDIARDPAIIAVTIRRTDGEILAHAGDRPDPAHLLTVTSPVELGSEQFGQITILLATNRVERISQLLLLSSIAAVILFHFLGLLLSSMALKKTVLQPLATLNRALNTVRDGDYSRRITIAEPAELATIGATFNAMATTIQDNFTAISRQQERLELEQNKLETIVGSMADGLFVTDNDGVIIAFNRAATAISGYTAREAIGTRCVDLFRSTLCADACALNHSGETIHNRETFLTNKEGRKLTVAVSSAMLYDSRGEAVGGVQTFRDITAEKRQQELYCHTEKLAAIGQLAAGVAHEINNPLSNILGYARYIKPDNAPKTIEKRVEVIIEQTRKCRDIVKGLLNFSRSSGADPQTFPFHEVIDRAREMVRYQAEKQGTRIHGDCDPAVFAYADPAKIEQVIFNLLLNALQTTPPATTIWISCGRAGNGVYCSITDDGPGIPPAIQSKIFDPFFTTKPVGQGTGLGLSICAGIIAEADGSIDLEERPGGGAVFTILLPTARKTAKERQ